jgi:Domain of unknown function (DUF4190)/zinc-ribbon domain
MANVQPTPICPSCGKEVDPSALACPACGQELVRDTSPDPAIAQRPRPTRRRDDHDDYADIIRRRPRKITNDPNAEVLDWIVPLRESLWAIAAGYCGLFACFPLVGVVPAVLAIAFGIFALKDIKRNKGRRGAFRAWFGIVLGVLMSLVWGLFLVMVLVSNISKH